RAGRGPVPSGHGFLDDHRGQRIPAQDVQDLPQVWRHRVQHHAPAGPGFARRRGSTDDGPEPGDVAVFDRAEVDVEVTSTRVSRLGQARGEVRVAELVDLPG